MHKKVSLGLTIGLIIIFCALTAAGTTAVITKKYNTILGGIPQRMKQYEILDEVIETLEKSGSYGENLRFGSAAAKAFVAGLDGSEYLTADEYRAYRQSVSGKMTGIGVKYTRGNKGTIKITAVSPGSPADSAGLKKNDVIVAFDGIKITEKNYAEMSAKLTDDKLSQLSLIYERDGREKSLTLPMGYEAQSVSTGVYENVGYIAVSGFYTGTPAKISEALESFTLSGVAAVVLDLRENDGENCDIAVEALDLFVPMSATDRPAVKAVDVKGKTVKEYSTASGEINLPLGVLIDAETACAAEVFAASLRDFGKAEIFGGENSAGNSRYLRDFELSDGSGLILNLGSLVPMGGESYDSVGITPDYTIKDAEKAAIFKEDRLFLYAVSVLTRP
ncbi:MAG: S41 family peptidase [Acutalibacteraceae bacterium]